MNLPVHPDELTAPWLTEALRASGAVDRAKVVDFVIEPMSVEKGITGYLVRLYPTYDRPDPAAPASLVAKFSGLDPSFVKSFTRWGSTSGRCGSTARSRH